MVSSSDLVAARRLDYGEKYTVHESVPAFIPDGFDQSVLSLPNGAKSVYREDKPTDSLQIRVYSDRVTIQRDRYNPKYKPIRHAVYDAPAATALAAVAAGAAISGGS